MVEVKNRLAVVTGASGGIGLEYCKVLAEMGADLLMVSIDEEPLLKAAEVIRQVYGVKTYSLTLDLCSDDAPDRIRAFIENFRLDPYILINNAGIFSFATVDSIPERKIDAFIDLHVRAATKLSITFAREFAARETPKGRKEKKGYILNMSSMSCWMPMPGIAMYAATKAYIRVFSRALYYEMRDSGVSVMVACPGGIATDLFGLPPHLKKLAVNIGAIAKPDVFAAKAIRKLLKGRKQYINGLTNRLTILLIGILPTPLRMQIKRRLLDRGIRKP
ncbi:MAG: SDR family NAD(P)-dependent oxidoreductase [Bacteroides sp.]|nr:SDR family NAD(P)-dependent oxidoreductase [Bacteroides sp.]